jgi:hypothetical protein
MDYIVLEEDLDLMIEACNRVWHVDQNKSIKENLKQIVRCKDCECSDEIKKVGNGITEPPYITIYRCTMSELGMYGEDFCNYGVSK